MDKAAIKKIREDAEASLLNFIRLVAPQRVLGDIHHEVINWWTKEDKETTHDLLLLPRAHQKSQLIAYRVAWWITKNPDVTIMYVSSKYPLAQQQLKAIKDILTSKIYRRYWPEMIEEQEGKRELWTNEQISVDHPKRKEEGVRDPTVFTASLTAGKVGFHCDVAVFDDFVDIDNAYTEENRAKVRTRYSLLASVENPNALEWVVGTRYHPKDLYNDMLKMEEFDYDQEGNVTGSKKVFDIFERAVEDRGDGTGEYIWPRQQRKDGKWFGFNIVVWSKKKAQYVDQTQFRAQYYNDPNDSANAAISSDKFQYYDRKHINYHNGSWYYKTKHLSVYCAVDFAFSLKKAADYTAVVVVGVDCDHNYYILDIDRFKSDRIMDYFDSVKKLHSKWGFRKLRAETVSAQKVIVRELKEQCKMEGLPLSIDEYNPKVGSKEERIQATLEPRYDNLQVWHYKGGYCQVLEEELIMKHPPHDDLKDALTAAMDIAKAPIKGRNRDYENKTNVLRFHSRFGGIAR